MSPAAPVTLSRTTSATSSPVDFGAPSLATVLTLLSGAFLPILSFFVVNVALPSIGTDLQATPAQLQLVVGSYGIANATLVVVGGRLGDGIGRKRLFLIGMAGFTVFSLLCALAPTIDALLVFRVGQGGFAAMMTPQVLATISATMTGEHKARAFGLFGAAGGVAAALGQIVGGVLSSADIWGLSWRAVFLINIPIAVAAFLGARRLIPESKAETRERVDFTGAALLATTLVLLLMPLTEGRPLGWPVWVWGVLALAAPSLGGFLLHQRYTEQNDRVPLVPLSVLALPVMRIGLTIALAFFTAFGGFMFVFAVATQTGAHLTALQGGLTLLPMAIGFMAVSIFAPTLQRRWGATIIARGWAIQAVGYALLALFVERQWPDISAVSLSIPMVIIGFGGGLVMIPLLGVVVSQVSPQHAGLGSGILITAQQTCLSLGAATVGTLFFSWVGSGVDSGDSLARIALLITALATVSVPFSLLLARRPASAPTPTLSE